MINIETKTGFRTGSISWTVTQFSDKLQVIGHELVAELAVGWNPFAIVIDIVTKTGIRSRSIN